MRESDEGEWQRLDRGGCGSNTDKQGMVPCSGSRELNVVAHPQLVPAPLDDTEHFSSSIEKDIDEVGLHLAQCLSLNRTDLLCCQMRMFWMYIKKMLTNLKSMSTARLHTSLQKSVPMYSDKTIEQLDLLLQRLREEEAIELTSANSWRLKE